MLQWWHSNPISHCHSRPGTWLLFSLHVHFVKAYLRNRSFTKTKTTAGMCNFIMTINWQHQQTCFTENKVGMTLTSAYLYITSSSESFSMENAGLSFSWMSGGNGRKPVTVGWYNSFFFTTLKLCCYTYHKGHSWMVNTQTLTCTCKSWAGRKMIKILRVHLELRNTF